MSKFLVTGINGFVGRYLAEELVSNGHQVIGVGGPSSKQSVDHLEKYIQLDLTDPKGLEEIDFTGLDGVVHLAGLAAVGPSFDEPNKYLQTNMGIQVNVMEAALKQKANPVFVIVSSAALYDPSGVMPITEDRPVKPNSPYAVSKIGQEQLAQYYLGRGLKCIIARPFNHIGGGQDLGFVLPDLVKQAVDVEKGLESKIRVGNLETKRDYTDVRDIVRAYRLLLLKGRVGEVYNICSGNPRSGQSILDSICKLMNIHPEIESDQSKVRPTDTEVIYGSHDKLTKDTGWTPEIAFEETVNNVISDWRSRK